METCACFLSGYDIAHRSGFYKGWQHNIHHNKEMNKDHISSSTQVVKFLFLHKDGFHSNALLHARNACMHVRTYTYLLMTFTVETVQHSICKT